MLLLAEDLAPAQLAVQQLVLALLVLTAGSVAPGNSPFRGSRLISTLIQGGSLSRIRVWENLGGNL